VGVFARKATFGDDIAGDYIDDLWKKLKNPPQHPPLNNEKSTFYVIKPNDRSH
jgi:hypothetical protein